MTTKKPRNTLMIGTELSFEVLDMVPSRFDNSRFGVSQPNNGDFAVWALMSLKGDLKLVGWVTKDLSRWIDA